MNIEGISHITFIVRDLDRATRFFCEGLGARLVYDSGDATFSLSPERFFLLGGIWIAVMQGSPSPERGYGHTAFKVVEGDLAEAERRLRALGVELRPPRPRVEGEGLSLYFHDFDNHLFELHSGTLTQRLQHYASAAPTGVAMHANGRPGLV